MDMDNIDAEYEELLLEYDLEQISKQNLLDKVRRDPFIFRELSSEYKNDLDIIKAVIQLNPRGLGDVSREIRSDKKIMMDLVNINGLVLKYASMELQDDEEVVTYAINNTYYAMEYASDRLKNDKDFILKHIEDKCYYVFEYASYELKNDKDFVMSILPIDNSILRYVSLNLRDDEEVIKKAVYSGYFAFALEYASDRLKSDKDFIMEILSINPFVLKHASLDLRNDPDVVKLAVTKNGCVLEYASLRLKSDKDFILKLIKDNGYHVFEYASYELKNDKDFVINLLKQNYPISKYLSKEILEDKEVAKILSRPKFINKFVVVKDKLIATLSNFKLYKSSNSKLKVVKSKIKQKSIKK